MFIEEKRDNPRRRRKIFVMGRWVDGDPVEHGKYECKSVDMSIFARYRCCRI